VVTFLFTDVEGSTRRWEAHADGMRAALGAHDEVLRKAIEAHGGWLFKHTGAGGYLFPGDDDGHLSARYVGKLMAGALPDHSTAHTLRHRFATRAYRGTRNLRAVQALLGHSSVATTERYTAVDDDEIRAAMMSAAGD
jgi:integrase